MRVCGTLELMKKETFTVSITLWLPWALCHPNFQEEKSNGVGISIDPIYDTQGTFYLNTQVGESFDYQPGSKLRS